jgi:hypothetical protein
MITSIKRSEDTKLGDMFEYNVSDVENTGTIEVVSSGNFPEAMIEYKSHLMTSKDGFGIQTDLTLTPSEINLFLSVVQEDFEHENYPHFPGVYTSRLIMNSYNQGNHNFNLNFKDHPLDFIGHLYGTEDHPLKISVEGNVGSSFAYFSQYLDVVINGNCGTNFGNNSTDIFAIINGDVGWNFALRSRCLSAIIKGDTENGFGDGSVDLVAFIDGKIERRGLTKSKLIFPEGSIRDNPKYQGLMQKIIERLGE